MMTFANSHYNGRDCNTQELIELKQTVSLNANRGLRKLTGVRNDSATNLARALSYNMD